MNRSTLLLLITFLVLTACTKYDEGPKISLRRDFKKFLGTWHIDKFYVNGFDSTASLKKEYGDSLYIKYYTKYKDNYYQEAYNDIYLFKRINEVVYYFKYYYLINSSDNFEIYNKNEVYGIALNSTGILGVENHNGWVTWKIKRLTKKEMNLEAIDNSNTLFRLEMTKVLDNGYVLQKQ